MKKGNIIFSTLFTIILSGLIVFTGYTYDSGKTPYEVYEVYLDGEKIGSINSKDELYELIDAEQETIKEKFGVDKVYPPNNLKVIKNVTYDNDYQTAQEIYNMIKDKSGFTIKGYEMIIIFDDPEVEKISISVLDDSIIEEALEKYAMAIIGEEEYTAFMNNTQAEVTDVGEILESVWFEETIKTKEAFINSDEDVYMDSQSLSHYLLFGNNDSEKLYTVKAGESIADIAYNNKLNVGEFLISNPSIKNENILLYPGQQVNVSMISPVLTLIYEKHIVYDEEALFETEVVYDSAKASTYSAITQDGETGINRITKKAQFVNGEENQGGVMISSVEIKPAINRIVTRGSKSVDYSQFASNNTWAWPTNSPYYISSGFGYRWGSFHEAIDIAGQKKNSPIYAANGGIVIGAGYEGNAGNCVTIDHLNGYYTLYGHLNVMYVSVGDVVSYGQIIGGMGETGRATGVHLHFGVWVGARPYRTGSVTIDPRTLYR